MRWVLFVNIPILRPHPDSFLTVKDFSIRILRRITHCNNLVWLHIFLVFNLTFVLFYVEKYETLLSIFCSSYFALSHLSRNNHRIHIGDAVYVRTVVSERYFQVHSMTRNGTVVDGKTTSVGTALVTATLESVRAVGGKEVKLKTVISAQEDMLIYPRLCVTPSHVIVPWDPTMTK